MRLSLSSHSREEFSERERQKKVGEKKGREKERDRQREQDDRNPRKDVYARQRGKSRTPLEQRVTVADRDDAFLARRSRRIAPHHALGNDESQLLRLLL